MDNINRGTTLNCSETTKHDLFASHVHQKMLLVNDVSYRRLIDLAEGHGLDCFKAPLGKLFSRQVSEFGGKGEEKRSPRSKEINILVCNKNFIVNSRVRTVSSN